MICTNNNFLFQNQKKYNTQSVGSKLCFGQSTSTLNADNKEQKQKMPTWGKIFISWFIGDIVTDLIIDATDENKTNKFNFLRPFSWLVKKFKK